MKSKFVFQPLEFIPSAFDILKKPPEKLYYVGDTNLLDVTHKIAIVGTRRPNPYTRNFTAMLAHKISQRGGIVVSGGALGTDIIAQNAALPRTIMVSPASLDFIYPPSNAPIITQIAKNGLILSEYDRDYTPKAYSFIERNRLVIALSELVIIPEADLCSGSIQSAKIAQICQKPIFVLPQRLDESKGTNFLLECLRAEAIYDIEAFIIRIFGESKALKDEILLFCENGASFEEAFLQYGEKILEYELDGKIVRENGRLRVLI